MIYPENASPRDWVYATVSALQRRDLLQFFDVESGHYRMMTRREGIAWAERHPTFVVAELRRH